MASERECVCLEVGNFVKQDELVQVKNEILPIVITMWPLSGRRWRVDRLLLLATFPGRLG